MPAKGRSKRKADNPKDDSVSVPKKSNKEVKKDIVESKYFADGSKAKVADCSPSKDKPTNKDNPQDGGTPRLGFSFYDVSCDQLAKDLLGKTLVTQKDGARIAGTIVETEAYMGVADKAAHSYNGKRTERTEAMFMQPGTAYVYNIYGMYCCINISAQGEGAAVLLRGIEPKENIDAMNKLRTKGKGGDSLLKHDGKRLSNGPSKLAQAFNISKPAFNKHDMCTSKEIWLENGETIDLSNIVISTRINIDYAEDWTSKPLRFYVKGNKYVSVRDKKAEENMDS